MIPRLKLSQRAILLVSVPLLFELVFFATFAVLVTNVEREADEIQHLSTVATKGVDIVKRMVEVQQVRDDFRHSRDPEDGQKYLDLLTQIHKQFLELRELKASRPDEQKMIDEALPAVNRLIDIQRKVKTLMETGRFGSSTYKPLRSEEVIICGELYQILQALNANSYSRMKAASENEKQGRTLVKITLCAGVVLSLILCLILARVLTKGVVRRIEVLQANAVHLSSNQPLTPIEKGDDEIADLDRVFHQMADSLTEAARKERAVVENALDVICSLDRELQFQKVSPASERVWGRAPGELLRTSLLEILLPDKIAQASDMFEKVRSGSGSSTFELDISSQDGRIVPCLWTARWVESEQSFFCVAHDVTERRELDQLKREFVSMVSHDLRSPLTSVLASLNLLELGAGGDLNERGDQIVERAERELQRLVRLIEDILDFQRMDEGRLDLNRDVIDIGTALKDAIDAVKPQADRMGVSIEFAPVELRVFADQDRVIQLVVNLLSNAAKFSSQGSRVSVVAQAVDDFVHVEITDQGPGIPDDMKAKIFERYRQLDGESKKKRGTGLGLAICKMISDAHGGEIGVRDAPETGSSFWFTLPRDKT